MIEYAKSLNINFVYALSPGMDIEYSKVKDISAVKAKLEQVRTTQIIAGSHHMKKIYEKVINLSGAVIVKHVLPYSYKNRRKKYTYL